MDQVKWPVLGPELIQPVRAANINQLVEATVLLLRVMGYRRGPAKRTLSRSASKSNRYGYLYDAAAEAELGGGNGKDDEPRYRGDPGDFVKDYIRHLSFDKADQDTTQYLEVRSHVSLNKIAKFNGKRYRSDAALQWLKRFIYEMKGTRLPQNSCCEPFSLCLGRVANSWYRQLYEKTQRRWNRLSETFLDYYCSQFDQSARAYYYSVRRKVNEPIWDFLVRINGYARTTKIRYEKGDTDAGDHVEHFLLHCGDDDEMDLIYPLQLEDIGKVEQIINRRMLDEKRKKQRDRLTTMRSRDNK
ncbi:hypothetical protein Pcac1_g25998 [Phytophthora cactorum]|nr:hypothetical protein Pcac1_g25998 [Phytophthora cactorum]KAG2810844.1 hypothetical protein PC111_g15483 [Phytophthora cactorum]KAG2872516.1 hypothetical protein PC114_g26339 [Phytophthora cactorum]KAG2877340.1 hypothetical protein PC115_g23390 [Phytophthora cactorum]KAG2958275.1 hypothetical protein PC118_g23610 [Phytophthora cactorum]